MRANGQQKLRLRTLEEELPCCPGLRRVDVEALREWAKTQHHLPNLDEVPREMMLVILAMILKRRYNSMERAKETLDNFFTFRDLTPEISANRSIKRPEIQTYLSMNYNIVMDKKDCEGNIVLFHYLHDPDIRRYDFDTTVRVMIMVLEAWLVENGTTGAPGITLVIDQRNFSMSHMASVSLTTIKKLNHYNKNCTPVSIKSIYVVNANIFIQKILAIVKPFLQGELFKRIRIFTPDQMNELYKYVPQEAIPNELGGTAGPLEDLNRPTIDRLERAEEMFRKFDSLHVDESKRIGPQKFTNSDFGAVGSFKKLDVD